MIKTLQKLAAAVFAIGSIVFGLTWNARRQLPFNEEGRYFDAEHGTVLQEQSVMVYGTLTIAFALLALASWALSHSRKPD